jgi:hypothetical protein
MLGVHFGIGSDTLMNVEPALPEQFQLVSVTLMEGSPFAFQGSFSWFLIDMEPTYLQLAIDTLLEVEFACF